MTLVALPVRTLVFVGLLVSVLAWAGCAGTLEDPAAFTTESDSGAAASVDASGASCVDVPTTFATSCGTAGCHDPTTRAEGLDLWSPGVASRLVGVPAVEGLGLLIDPSTPSKSVVYTKLTATPPFGARMPTGSSLGAATIQCVLDWVTTEGASASSSPDGGAPPGVDAAATVDAGASDTGSVSPFATLRMAAGQTSAVTDAQGQTWSADASYTGGTPAVESPSVTITGTDSPELYNGQRYGNPSFSYRFAVPNGTYTVTLKFAELYVTGPGMRLFAIAINGATVETSFDIYAAAGAMNTAVDRSYPVTVSGGQIEIDFTQGAVQFPKVDAIQIAQGAGGDGGK
ncbi:MAG TPA: malectin [Polyangiaceae bacterium]